MTTTCKALGIFLVFFGFALSAHAQKSICTKPCTYDLVSHMILGHLKVARMASALPKEKTNSALSLYVLREAQRLCSYPAKTEGTFNACMNKTAPFLRGTSNDLSFFRKLCDDATAAVKEQCLREAQSGQAALNQIERNFVNTKTVETYTQALIDTSRKRMIGRGGTSSGAPTARPGQR